MIYLDHNATTPTRPEACEAMRPWLTERCGNPASAHAAGRQARRVLEDARERLAALLGAHPDEVIYTSGATEANNLALFGLAGEPPGHLLVSPVEHPCVIEPARQLAQRGFALDWLPVDAEGLVTVAALPGQLRSDTQLIAVMLVNHETGAVQPITELAGCALGVQPGMMFHCDAAQAVGKIAVDFHALGVTSLSVSGHKLGGPPGIGALLLSRCAKLRPLFFGGHQQRGRRPGTESVALAIGLTAALEACMREYAATIRKMEVLRDRLLATLQSQAAPVVVNGPEDRRLPHVLNLSFPGCRGDALLMALDLAGVACSTGSACSSGSLLPSPVLRAMGVSEDRLLSALRFSFGANQEEAEIADAAQRVVAVVNRLRQIADD